MKTILITGFDPFGGESINPAWEAARRVQCGGANLIYAEIPTSYARGPQLLRELIKQHRPDAVLCIGQAGGRRGISLERVAINMMDASIPDNDGVKHVDEPIDPQDAPAYFSTLPIRRMQEHLHSLGLTAAISNTAGTFVCNRVMYEALSLNAQLYPHMRCGFIHVPYLPQQVEGKPEGTPSLPLQTMVYSLNEIVHTLIKELEDEENADRTQS